MPLLLPTAYLPPISYMAGCTTAEEVMIEIWETYPKQTVRNHCDIYGPNGRQRLTIPVSKPDGNRTMTKDVRINDALPWQSIHWRSFEAAYNKSPFFLYYQDYLIPFYERKFSYLLDFNLGLLDVLFQALRINRQVILTGHYEKHPPDITDRRDYPDTYHPESGIRYPVSGIRQPETNIPPCQGVVSASLRHRVTRIAHPEYHQVFGDRFGFLHDLSIVDLLFNTGPETIEYLSMQ